MMPPAFLIFTPRVSFTCLAKGKLCTDPEIKIRFFSTLIPEMQKHGIECWKQSASMLLWRHRDLLAAHPVHILMNLGTILDSEKHLMIGGLTDDAPTIKGSVKIVQPDLRGSGTV